MRTPLILVVATLTLLTACSSADDTAQGASAEAATVTVAQVEPTAEEDVPSALDDRTADGFPDPLVALDELRSGGPPPDGIPPIDDPVFLAPEDVDFLADEEPVLALEIDGERRAYPVQVMIWHEIVNDTVAGVPVAVTYCPLCNTAIASDRRLGDRVLTFGTSGLLYRSSLVMYDRQTESLWSHVTSQAVVGALTGEELEGFPVATVAWSDWREASPDGLVLSRQTGFERDYGTNPYPGYDDVSTSPFLFDGEVDGRLLAKERVLGIGLDDDPIAIRHDPLVQVGVQALEVGDAPAVAWATPGTATALEGTGVADGRDIGATGVFLTTVDGQVLTFQRAGDGFTDDQTASSWNILGTATAGPLAGAQLEAIEHVDTFWFAWAAFSPETTVIDPTA